MRFSRMHRGLASPINLSDDSKFIIPMECLINQSRVIMLSYILFCQLWNVTLDLSRLTKCINIIIYNYYFKFPTNTFMLFGNLQKGKSFKKLSYLFFFFFSSFGACHCADMALGQKAQSGIMLRSLYSLATNCLASLCTWRPSLTQSLHLMSFFLPVRMGKAGGGGEVRKQGGGGFQLLQVASWDPRCPLLCSTSNVVNMRPFICKAPWVYNGLAVCVCMQRGRKW